MSDFKLYNIKEKVKELVPSAVLLEKELQSLIENNMKLFFGVRFVKSEYIITDGRMDSIGIDENNCPVIFEYKKNTNANVINQGLFYLDWLLDHKGDFTMLVMNTLGKEAADNIDWSYPCVICIANDFTRYDVHAVNQMQRNIKLVKYRKYPDGLIAFEHLNAPKTMSVNVGDEAKKSSKEKMHEEKVNSIIGPIKVLYDSVCEYIEEMGDEIVANQLKFYLAYKKVQNIACIEIYTRHILIYLKLDPDTVDFEEGFSRDMRKIGHFGTGDVELKIKDEYDFEKAKPLIDRAYNEG